MIPVLFATALDPFSMIRIEDPDWPGAEAHSATGSVVLEPPPPGTRWRYESVAETDVWRSEEALRVTNAAEWQRKGYTGQGVRIAVFDPGWYGSELDRNLEVAGTQDCWTSPTCEPEMDSFRPRFANEEGVHGHACAEVVHDIVPDAELYLVRVNGFTSFENAVDWAIRNEIDLISLSVSFYNDSFYDGTGPYTPLVQRLVANDVLLVTSAGNDAESHWEGPYIDADADGRMDFDGENGLWAYLLEGTRNAYVTWNQYNSCGHTDLDVIVTRANGNVAGRSERRQVRDADDCGPVERLAVPVATEGWYKLEVHHRRGASAGVQVSVHTRNFSLRDPDPHSSVVDPAAQAGSFAVGAVRADGYLRNDVEFFSSWGPNTAGLSKPEIAGPDGLSTDTYGGVGFYGTSASTPVVTALIAQILSAEPQLTPAEAGERLQLWALSHETGFGRPDPRWGAGKARLPVDVDGPTVCGQRPLLGPLFLLPLGWLRRRRRSRRQPTTPTVPGCATL